MSIAECVGNQAGVTLQSELMLLHGFQDEDEEMQELGMR